MVLLVIGVVITLFLMATCESQMDPYEEGIHMNYRIHCENGFVYKHQYDMTIQVFNSDGTPLKCGKKIY